jgi:choline dehydrogenase-like flavoprotein
MLMELQEIINIFFSTTLAILRRWLSIFHLEQPMQVFKFHLMERISQVSRVGLLPTSRGTVKLASSDPSSKPLVDANNYATEADKCTMREGTRQILRMMLGTSEGRDIIDGSTPPAGCPELTLASTDEEIDVHIRKVAQTLYHPAGTAAMGSVVDSEMILFGVEGLRVVDASVLPVALAGHYQIPLYAMAEQASDLILAA